MREEGCEGEGNSNKDLLAMCHTSYRSREGASFDRYAMISRLNGWVKASEGKWVREVTMVGVSSSDKVRAPPSPGKRLLRYHGGA